MKRKELLRQLAGIASAKGLALQFVRHGGRHDVYTIGTEQFIIARHPDINEITARATIRKADKL